MCTLLAQVFNHELTGQKLKILPSILLLCCKRDDPGSSEKGDLIVFSLRGLQLK